MEKIKLQLRDEKNPQSYQALIRDIESKFNLLVAQINTLTDNMGNVVLYDSQGLEIGLPPGGVYSLPVGVIQSAATVAGSTVWAMRNGATKTVRLRRIYLTYSFYGTAAASFAAYALCRFSTATPSGGNSLTIVKNHTNYVTSTVASARSVDTGLTMTSVVKETAFAYVGGAHNVGPTITDLRFTPYVGRHDAFELAPNEGLLIDLAATAVIGGMIFGTVEWDEV